MKTKNREEQLKRGGLMKGTRHVSANTITTCWKIWSLVNVIAMPAFLPMPDMFFNEFLKGCTFFFMKTMSVIIQKRCLEMA